MNPESSKWAAINAAAAQRPHGTHARYVAAKCRCFKCRVAHANYTKERAHKNDGGGRVISSEPARAHILKLAKKGMGYKPISEASGVNHNIVWGIRKGLRPRARFGTVQRILAVDLSAAKNGTRIPARATWAILDELIDLGYSRRQLAAWLGYTGSNPALQLRRDVVTAQNANRVERLKVLLDAGKLSRGDASPFAPVKPRNTRGRGLLPEHATRKRYLRGCRCETCTAANSDYTREWARDNRAKAKAGLSVASRHNIERKPAS